MHFATGKDILGEHFLLAGHDELVVFLEIELVLGIEEAILHSLYLDVYLVGWL